MTDAQDLEEGGRPRKKGVDRIEEPARALVLVPDLRQRGARDDAAATTQRDLEARLEEASGLANAIDLDVHATSPVPVSQPKPATLFGAGKVEEIGETVKEEGIDLVIVDHALTPIQQRNLGAMDGHIEEVYTGHNVVKAYNGERAAKETFDEISQPLPARQILSGEAETNSSDCAIGAATTRSTCFCWLVALIEALMRSVAAQPLSW